MKYFALKAAILEADTSKIYKRNKEGIFNL